MSAPRVKSPLDHSQLIIIGVAVGMLACFIGLVCVPDARTLKRVKASLSDVEQRQTDRAEEVKGLPELAEQVGKMKQEHLRSLTRIPDEGELPQFLGTVADILRDEGITQQELVPGNPRPTDKYVELPISIKFESTFPPAFRVLSRLEQLERINQVETLKFSVDPRSAGRLKVELSVVIYRGNRARPKPAQLAAVRGAARI